MWVNKFDIIGSDNGLSPVRHQTNIWTNADLLPIEPSGTNFSEILITISIFPFKKMRLKMSAKLAILYWPQWVKNEWVIKFFLGQRAARSM